MSIFWSLYDILFGSWHRYLKNCNHCQSISTPWNIEYCHRVFLLLEFLAAERDSKCIQHIEAFQQMICYDAAFDNYKYFKWGIVYLLDMNNLSSTRPDLYEMFLCGYHTVPRKKTKSSFNCVSTDVALEQSFKKDTKTKGTKQLCCSLEKKQGQKWHAFIFQYQRIP